MNKRIKRILALVLSLLMIIQIMPVTAMAETVTDELSSDNSLPDEWAEPDSTTDPEEVDPEENESQPLVEDLQPSQDNEEKPDKTASDDSDGQQVYDLPDGFEDERDFYEDEYVDSPEDAPEPDPDEEDPAVDPYEDGNELPEDTEVIYDDPEYFEPWEPASEEEEVEVLYDGSWIRYGVYKYGHTYALTEGTTCVYDDSGLGADHLICTLPDEYTPLLVTEHYQRGNTLGVTVWFVLPDGTLQTGYVRESDLVNAIYTDEEAETWTEYMDYRQINVDGASLLAFVVNGVAFAATENEPESEVPSDEPVDVHVDEPIDEPIEQITEEETEPIPETEETEAETEVLPEEELIEELPVEEEPLDEGDVIETVTARSGAVTYGTLRAESEMPVPITTRPRAYIFANRRGYVSINSADGGVFTTYNNTYSVGKLVATIRSREISACLILQTQSQLKAIYKDNADTIIGNMDSVIFLGGKEQTTLKSMEETLGKETIDTYNTGESRGREVSHSLNYQKLGKSLMSMDELAVMDGGMCILQLRGVRPFFSHKYDITQHPNYRYLSDADPRNALDIERFLSTRLRPKPDEEYDVIEVTVDDADLPPEEELDEEIDEAFWDELTHGGDDAPLDLSTVF